jgi:hypothetical protein
VDETFVVGLAAFISAVLIFCGSVWLLLAVIMGPKLAYFVSASVTLGFLLIMGAVWSYGTPLGPVGQMPSWNGVDAAAVGDPLDFGPASSYPDSPWAPADPEDAHQVTIVGELENAASDFLEEQLGDDKLDTFERVGDAIIDSEQTRLLTDGGDQYGAVTFTLLEVEPEEGEEEAEPVQGEDTVVVMEYDPGNPSKPARMITAGTFILFLLHLFGLSRSEKRSNRDGTTTA